MMLSFFAGVGVSTANPWGASSFIVPLGARFNLPIIHDGFVPQINDSLDIEFGIDVPIAPSVCCGYTPIYFTPVIEPRYSVYLLPKLTAYVKPLNLGIVVWPGNNVPGVIFFRYEFALGAIYELTKTFYVRAQMGFGYPENFVLRAGLGLAF
jgi:hypothetical protein